MLNYMPNTQGLPSVQHLDEYFEGWSPDESEFMGKDLIPISNHAYPDVRWTEQAGATGMAPAHALDAPSPTRKVKAKTERMESPLYFGEKQELVESDFLHVRSKMALDQYAGYEMVEDGQKEMIVRNYTRVEWSRWQAAQGSLAIDENGVKRTITYPVTSISNPSVSWATIASATPLANLQAFAILFRGKGWGRLRCYFNAQIGAYLSQNAAIQTAIRGNEMAKLAGTDNIAKALTILVGNIDFYQYDGGYTDDSDVYNPFIPDTKIVLVKPAVMNQPLGYFKTTPSIKNGGPFNPKPGRFNWVKDDTANTDCPKYSYGSGIYGVPVLNFPANFAPVTVVF